MFKYALHNCLENVGSKGQSNLVPPALNAQFQIVKDQVTKKEKTMILCFPVEEEKNIHSIVFNHFGSAPGFVLYDTETKAVNPLENKDLNHTHGQCSPIKALDGNTVDAVIVGGIGMGAINKLNSMGISVFKSPGGTIEDNVASFENQELVEMKPEDACGGHAGGECAH